MALLEPQVGVGSVTGAHRTGDDHRLTGSMEITLPGTSTTGCCYVHGAPIRYVASDGNEYTDTVAPETAAIVWTPDPTPPTDPHHIGDLAYTLAAGATTFDNRRARWKIFAPAMYGGATYLLAARSCDFGDATGALAAILASTAGTANTAGDILILEYVNSPGQVRRLQHGCSACGSGASNITLQLIAGTPPLNTATPKVPQNPDHVPDDAVPAATAQIYPPQSLYRDAANKLLYIGCDQGVRVVDATGQITTVLGTNDPLHQGTNTDTDPLNHHVVHATAIRQFADGSLLAASDRGSPIPVVLGVPDYNVDSRDANHCLVNLHAAPDDALQNPQGLITVTTPGLPGAGASVQDDYFLITPWTNANPPGGRYPFSEAFTTGLAITSTGRILQAYSAIHTWHYVSGDGNPFLASGTLARITDRSATPNVDLLWAYNEYQGAPSTPIVCSGNNGYDLRNPQGIWLKDDNTLLIAAAGNGAILSLDLTTNVVTVVPGTAGTVGTPTGVCLDSAGNIVVADMFGHCIRRVTGTVVTVIAGVEGQAGCSQWDPGALAVVPATELHLGPAKTTMLNQPRSVFPGPNCSIYITDTQNKRCLLLSCGKSKN